MSADGELFGKLAVAQDLYIIAVTAGQTGSAHRLFIDPGTLLEAIEGFQVDGQITNSVAGIIEAALGDAADQRHLAAFEANADGTAGASRLAFAAATAGFAVTAGFALAEALAPVFCAGTRFKIV